MKNLLQHTDSLEKLEDLPSRERNHDYSWDNDDYFGKKMPYRRMMRWLESQEGIHIDSVIHKFVNLKWLLPVYRTLDVLRKKIEMDTFIEDGKICFYSSWCYWGKCGPRRIVEDETSKTIYVHPKTRLVCVHRPLTRESWKKREQEKLDKKLRILGDFHQLYKESGIWYEVKAEPIDRNDSGLRNRKPFLGWGDKLKPKDIILETKLGFMPSFKIVLKRQLSRKDLKKYNLTNN
jgi:hypothetical protein